MNELIKVTNDDFGRYEELLLRRDKIKKEAHSWQLAYMKEFGDVITELFKLKIECIKKKKAIAFCQAAVNKGQTISQSELEAYLETETKAYYEQLQDMIDQNDIAHSGTKIDSTVVVQVKKLYRKIAKLIHPDINPRTNDTEELKKLWNMVVVSYQANDFETLQESEVLVNRALDNLGLDSLEIEIKNLDQKIEHLEEEILHIKETDPYQYKFLLMNQEAVQEKHTGLEKEQKEYQDYEKQLDQIMDQLMMSGVSMIWQMN